MEHPTETFMSSPRSCGARVFSVYQSTYQGSPRSFLLGAAPLPVFCLITPTPAAVPKAPLTFECPQIHLALLQEGCASGCHPLLPQLPASISLQTPFHTPGLGLNIELIIKQFLLLIENSLQGVNSRRKKRAPLNCELAGNPRRARIRSLVFEERRPVCTGCPSPGELCVCSADNNTRQPSPRQPGAR